MQRFQALPEELIREVLSHVIDVATDAEFFSSNGKREEYYSNKPARWREPLELRAAERRPSCLSTSCCSRMMTSRSRSIAEANRLQNLTTFVL